jgi:hypothetical protein
MKIAGLIVVILAVLLFIGWLGFRVQPKPFPSFPAPSGEVKTIPLPEGLPAPVERYYRHTYGDRIPVIETAAISGRATMAPVGGLDIPARFRFVHNAGQDYRHYFEMTWFGRRFGVGNEHYLDGVSALRLPFGLSDRGSQVDQAANLSLWAEYAWLPAVWLTDPRVRWEPVDDETARLVVPFGGEEETFVMRFDPASGDLVTLEGMRYKDSKSTAKTLWRNESSGFTRIGDAVIPRSGAVTWVDQGTPWAVFNVEDVVLNPQVESYLREGQE